jgi:putative FmdB family regulatory protein
MPTYEYKCDACQHRFDEFQAFSDPVLTKCPKCNKIKLRRLFGTGAAVLFKGSGFYETDYRSESYKAAAKADAEKASSASTNGASSTTGANGTSSGETTAPGGKSAGKRSRSAE